MTAAGISDPLPGHGAAAKAKIILLGPPDFPLENLMHRARSLNIEHVSPRRLQAPEISRRAVSAAADEARRLALMRRWFFARKPDAGFLLTEFPATLLQALVFDEWLDARDETLDRVLASPAADSAVVSHYRTLGLLDEAAVLA
ncbi:MAG: adenylate kinase [Opitutaceae bacterium]|nr:adenylate kinase [Opitutaceae bacterium]